MCLPKHIIVVGMDILANEVLLELEGYSNPNEKYYAYLNKAATSRIRVEAK